MTILLWEIKNNVFNSNNSENANSRKILSEKLRERERERELEKEVESIFLLIGRSYWKFYTLVKFYTYRTVMLDILFLKVILFYLALTYCGQMCSVGVAMHGIGFRECTLKMCFTFFYVCTIKAVLRISTVDQ